MQDANASPVSELRCGMTFTGMMFIPSFPENWYVGLSEIYCGHRHTESDEGPYRKGTCFLPDFFYMSFNMRVS
jgi:hypothetical protein